MSKSRTLPDCVACGAALPEPFLNLGMQPLANSYHKKGELVPRFPLAVAECRRCSHRQLTFSVDPEILFRNYLYTSGTTKTLREYFSWFIDEVEADFGDRIFTSILDIGCNDGTLVEMFQDRGYDSYGIDPAENLTEDAVYRGLNIKTAFWDCAYAINWPYKHDVIVAMNVVPHGPDPMGFLLAAKRVLAPGGKIYVQTSQADWIEHGEFDCVYHEHISYFTPQSMEALAKRCGLVIESYKKVPIHGTSYLFTLTDPRGSFATEVRRIAEWTIDAIDLQRRYNIKVIGYGAAAKAMTFLNYAKISLDYIVDDNPLKCGLQTPGMDIEIKPTSILAEEEGPIAIIILAWNFEEEVIQRVKAIRQGKETKFIKYFPKQEFIY